MENNKDILLDKLFAEAARTKIADNGFTRHVMRRLPSHAERYSRIWTAVCTLAAIVMLTYFKAWNYLLDGAINAVCAFNSIDWLHILPLLILLSAVAMLVSSVLAYRELRI